VKALVRQFSDSTVKKMQTTQTLRSSRGI